VESKSDGYEDMKALSIRQPWAEQDRFSGSRGALSLYLLLPERMDASGAGEMKFWIGITDLQWFEFLADLQPDEVNFWQPSAKAVRVIEPGAPFLFKLHSPRNFIVGGGFFVRHSVLPLSMAWNVFRESNGADSFMGFREQVTKYRSKTGEAERDPVIGCSVLTSPFFFEERDWIPQPSDWSPNIVIGKSYDTNEAVGSQTWEQVQERLTRIQAVPVAAAGEEAWNVVQRERYGQAYPFQPRLGQGAFRVAVTEAYQRRCTVTGERTLPVLEACHIKPFAKSGPHDITNGLLLRSDLHILFDQGYMTITEDLRVEVSHRIKEEFENGRDYYAFQGQPLVSLPSHEVERPSREFVRWHNQHVFDP
jgi:putative restriction endonuclease